MQTSWCKGVKERCSPRYMKRKSSFPVDVANRLNQSSMSTVSKEYLGSIVERRRAVVMMD